MKKALKVIGKLLLAIIILAGLGIAYIMLCLPNTGKARAIKVVATPYRLERGAYLANSVAVCMDCHSKRDWNSYAGPLVLGTEGQGGETFDQKFGFPGSYYSRNITPYGIGNWTDGEIYRAITEGVSRDGHAMFPVMPYPYYKTMDTEDVYSIIAYIRTLKPIKNDVVTSKPDFPMNIIIHTIPSKATPKEKPSAYDSLAYGKYLVNIAACMECHTQVDKGQVIPELAFGGGREFKMPFGTVRSQNITPDEETGIGSWSCEQFLNRFKQYQKADYTPAKLSDGDYNTAMPWMMYSKMTDADLTSIYKYLRTVKPIKNSVTKFSKKA